MYSPRIKYFISALHYLYSVNYANCLCLQRILSNVLNSVTNDQAKTSHLSIYESCIPLKPTFSPKPFFLIAQTIKKLETSP